MQIHLNPWVIYLINLLNPFRLLLGIIAVISCSLFFTCFDHEKIASMITLFFIITLISTIGAIFIPSKSTAINILVLIHLKSTGIKSDPSHDITTLKKIIRELCDDKERVYGGLW